MTMDHYPSICFFGDRWLQAVRDLPTLSDFLDEYEANVVVPGLRSAESSRKDQGFF
jgi:3'-phosphoadenosine 5'-phosphosulfate sulfotransferase (PAPS reductase)/FAD synthetase